MPDEKGHSDLDLFTGTVVLQADAGNVFTEAMPLPETNVLGPGTGMVSGPKKTYYHLKIVCTRGKDDGDHLEARRYLAQCMRDAADLIEAELVP